MMVLMASNFLDRHPRLKGRVHSRTGWIPKSEEDIMGCGVIQTTCVDDTQLDKDLVKKAIEELKFDCCSNEHEGHLVIDYERLLERLGL